MQHARAHVFRWLPVCVCVCVCVVVYVCILWMLCITVCWRRAPRIGQACLIPQSALFANINPAPLEGHAHASKSSQATHLSSQAQWSRSRCYFPNRTGRLPSMRSQRPRVSFYDSRTSSCFVYINLHNLSSHIVLFSFSLHGPFSVCALPAPASLLAGRWRWRHAGRWRRLSDGDGDLRLCASRNNRLWKKTTRTHLLN